MDKARSFPRSIAKTRPCAQRGSQCSSMTFSWTFWETERSFKGQRSAFMLVTNKNQIESPNEGFLTLTYWCKLNTIIASLHIFLHYQFQKKIVSVLTACINIYLPTCVILLYLSSVARLKMRSQNQETSFEMAIFSSLRRTNGQEGSFCAMRPTWHPPAQHIQHKGKSRISERRGNCELGIEFQWEINHPDHEGKETWEFQLCGHRATS